MLKITKFVIKINFIIILNIRLTKGFNLEFKILQLNNYQ